MGRGKGYVLENVLSLEKKDLEEISCNKLEKIEDFLVGELETNHKTDKDRLDIRKQINNIQSVVNTKCLGEDEESSII